MDIVKFCKPITAEHLTYRERLLTEYKSFPARMDLSIDGYNVEISLTPNESDVEGIYKIVKEDRDVSFLFSKEDIEYLTLKITLLLRERILKLRKEFLAGSC